MIFIDTSAWIEFFNDTGHEVVNNIDYVLDNELVCLGDLVLCEVMQGIKNKGMDIYPDYQFFWGQR